MSLTKRYMEEEEARAYYTSEDSVCARCFDDEGIKGFIQQHLIERQCSVCQRKARNLIAAPADKVLEFITDRLHRHYEDAYGNAYFDKEAAEYTVMTWGMAELIYEELEDGAPSQTLEWLQEQMKTDVTYCRRNWQVMSAGEGLTFSWERFSKAIRHETRFMFFPDKHDDGGEPFFVQPAQVLDEVGGAVRRCDLVTSLPAGTRIFRVRGHAAGKCYTTGPELGPPAPEHARTAGRMNAPGIVVAYASFEAETALAEASGKYADWSLGEFKLLQEVRVVDLTEVPNVPSIFEDGPRESLLFLNRFVADVSEPFTPDSEPHVEYTPTQVVSEYLRHRFRDKDGRGVRGILYPSAKVNGMKNLALFISSDEVMGAPIERWKKKNPAIKLVRAKERKRK